MPQPPVHHSSTHDWVQPLRAKGLRAAAQRVAVPDFLHPHPHTDAIFQAAPSSLPTISLQPVHLIVRDLSEKNLIRRISLPDSANARDETHIKDNHHHIQCIQCGRVEDVDCVVGYAPCIDSRDTHGMRIVEASLVFRGIRHDCDASTQRTE